MSGVALAVGVIGAGASAYSASQSKKGGGGQMGYDVVVPKSVGESSRTGREGADYWSNAMQGMATGDPHRGYGPYEELMKRKLQRGQQEAFYGTPGSRSTGAYGAGIESGALLGLGTARTQAGLRPLQNQWTTGSQNIEEFLAQQRQQAMQQREGTLLNYGLGLSQPYGQQLAPYQNPGLPAQTDPWAGIVGDLAGSGALNPAVRKGLNWMGGKQSGFTYQPAGYGVGLGGGTV